MLRQQRVSIPLLRAAGIGGPEPAKVGDILRLYDMHVVGHLNDQRSQDMWRYIERGKANMYRDLKDGGRRVHGAVDDARTRAVPATTAEKRTFAAMPRGGMALVVQPPRHQFGASQYAWEWRHV
jgi:hypothetical protein